MPTEFVYLAFEKDLYTDALVYSEGRFDPASHLEAAILKLIEDDLAIDHYRHFGSWTFDFADKYFPDTAADWRFEEIAEGERPDPEDFFPMVWKEVTVWAGTEVRMHYDGKYHYAKVGKGSIIDDGVEYSPSEWARKVANNTSRNAWRDLWFKESGARVWMPAQLMREQALEEMHKK